MVLPDDMKRFYLCIDGFCLYWSYEYSGKYITKSIHFLLIQYYNYHPANDVKRVGKIHIPHLIQITLVRENLETIITNPAATTKPVPPTISSNSKTVI